jgi:flagellar basal-body rod protein FlgB
VNINLFGNIDLLQKGLQASQMRHDVILNNIANVSTPGFKASHVEFESYMADAMDENTFVGTRTNEKHIDIGGSAAGDVEPSIVTDSNTTMRMDQNNVDIDQQNSELAKNTIYYDTLVRQISGEISRLKMAIDGK